MALKHVAQEEGGAVTVPRDRLKLSEFVCLFFGATAPPPPQWASASSFTGFLDHTQWRTTVGRTPLDEWSARRRDLYLTTHNTHNWQTSMSLVGLEPKLLAGERPQMYALDRAASGTGKLSECLDHTTNRITNYYYYYYYLFNYSLREAESFLGS